VIDSILCFFGWHDWETFRHEPGQKLRNRMNVSYSAFPYDKWIQDRICLRCNLVDDKITQAEKHCKRSKKAEAIADNLHLERQDKARFLTKDRFKS
jgi:hypothetical protein